MSEFFDKSAETYSKLQMKNVAGWEDAIDRIRKHLTPTSRVLEVGCGTGSVALKLSSSCSEIVSTDISTNMVEIARKKGIAEGVTNVKFSVADAVSPPEGEYDVVMGMNMLNCCEYPEKVMKELYKRVKVNGVMAAKIRVPENKWWFILTLPVVKMLGKMPEHAQYFDKQYLKEMFEKVGFRVIDEADYENPKFQLVIGRKI